MSNILGVIIIVLGLISFIVGLKNECDSSQLFLAIGFAFILSGSLKLLKIPNLMKIKIITMIILIFIVIVLLFFLFGFLYYIMKERKK